VTAQQQVRGVRRPPDCLLFDVFGTVVDVTASRRAETEAAVVAAGYDADVGRALADDWGQRHAALVEQIAQGGSPWRPNTVLRRVALGDAIAAADLTRLGPEALKQLSTVGSRSRPWPDAPRGLRTLAQSFTVIALSNGAMAELVQLSRAGGLLWHAVLSGELVKAYKPAPAVYRLALDVLELDRARTMMVAAHPWDLRAAAEHGLRTAFVSRPQGSTRNEHDHFDVYVDDLNDLAQQLTP
jgi:2-haloacid dehalogenase